MDDDTAQKFINSVVKNLQVLCHSNVNFNKNVEVIGHLYLNVDSCTRLNYIVNEKVCKNEASSTVFVSNSFHAEIGSRKKDREPNKPPDDSPPNFQRSQFLHRQSLDSNSHKREHPGQLFSPGAKMPRLSDYPGNKSESRQPAYKSPFSPSSRHRLSQDSGSDQSQSLQNSPQKRESPIEIDLTKVKKEFSSGGCAVDRTDGQDHSSNRLGGAFGSESDATPTIDFTTAFPISLHQNQTLSSAISQHETTVVSGKSHNNSAGAGGSSSDFEIDQKPFVHNTIAEPLSPQFSPMIPGGVQRLRPPWLGGEHSGNPSAASSSQQNFSDVFRFAKRNRTVFTQFQLQTLEEVFQMSPYLSSTQKRELSGALNVSIETLSKWFQNRRQRPRKNDPAFEKLKRPDLTHPHLYYNPNECMPTNEFDKSSSDAAKNIDVVSSNESPTEDSDDST